MLRLSVTETPNQIGRRAEDRAAEILEGARVVQSGGGKFLKLDVKDGVKFIYSDQSVKIVERHSAAGDLEAVAGGAQGSAWPCWSWQ